MFFVWYIHITRYQVCNFAYLNCAIYRESSVVGIASGLWSRQPRYFGSIRGMGKRLFFKASRQFMGPTKPYIQGVPRALSPGMKRLWREVDHTLACSDDKRNEWSHTSFFQYASIRAQPPDGLVNTLSEWSNGWNGRHVWPVGDKRWICSVLEGNVQREDHFEDLGSDGKVILKIDLK